MQKPDTHKTTEQVEFYIDLEKILPLIDPDEVQDGDVWSYVDGGAGTLVLVRKRETFVNMKRDREIAALKAIEEAKALEDAGLIEDEKAPVEKVKKR